VVRSRELARFLDVREGYMGEGREELVAWMDANTEQVETDGLSLLFDFFLKVRVLRLPLAAEETGYA
jgi:hypothetical protein